MHTRNALLLAGVVVGATVWMIVLHLLLFSGSGLPGISGIGITCVLLLALNRSWLHPDAEALPRVMLRRSLFVALVLGSSFVLLLGALGA